MPWSPPTRRAPVRPCLALAGLTLLATLACASSKGSSACPPARIGPGGEDPNDWHVFNQTTTTDTLHRWVRTAMDCQADPCEDFYRYACGGYESDLRKGGLHTWMGRGFPAMSALNVTLVHDILEVARATKAQSPERARLAAFYEACIMENRLERTDLQQLSPLFASIDEVGSRSGLFNAIARLHAHGVQAVYELSFAPAPADAPGQAAVDERAGERHGSAKDPRESAALVVSPFVRPTYGLQEASIYLDPSPKGRRLRAEYEIFVRRMLTPTLGSGAAEASRRILAFETSLAERDAPRQSFPGHDDEDASSLEAATPEGAWPWHDLLTVLDAPVAARGVAPWVHRLVEDALERLAKDPELARAYLTFKVLQHFAPHLSERYRALHRDFVWRDLLGLSDRPDQRWRHCAATAIDEVSDLVSRYFGPLIEAEDEFALATDYFRRMKAAFAARLEESSWLDPETRRAALRKVDAMELRVGFPPTLATYDGVDLDPTQHVTNLLRLARHRLDLDLARVGHVKGPVRWANSALQANAWYNLAENVATFPAGVLHAPMFDTGWPLAHNLGGFGAVIAHEVAHGFDPTGSLFDAEGRRRDWWSPATREKFAERSQCLVDHYQAMDTGLDVRVRGLETLGETMADLVGLSIAHTVFRAWRREGSERTPGGAASIPGLTAEQLFFVSFAQAHCDFHTPEEERLALVSDPHPPPRLRINGTVSQYPPFARAFRCPAKAPLRAPFACEPW